MNCINYPDEDVFCAFTGTSAQSKNNPALCFVAVVLTNQRLLMVGQIKGSFEVNVTAQSFNIENINAISAGEGALIINMLGDEIRIEETSRDIVNNIVTDLDAAWQAVKAGR